MRKLRIPHPMRSGGAWRRPGVTGRTGLPLPVPIAPLALALALAACAELAELGLPPAPEPASRPVASEPAAEMPATLPASPAKAPAETEKAGPPAAPANAPGEAAKAGPEADEAAPRQVAKAPPSVRPEQIMGLTRSELSDLLGKPDFLRRDAPAEIWQYRGKECILDVFLYETGEHYRVFHFEVRDRTVEPVSTGRCFAALLGARKRDETG